MKLLNLIIIFTILATSIAIAGQIAIKDVVTTDVNPGETSDINILLENQGDSDIQGVSVSLDLSSSSLPFAPVGSAAEKTIDEIKESKQESASFQLVALPDAKPQIYKIPLIIKYGTEQESTLISIKVISEPILGVAIEESDLLKIGDTGKVTIRLVNKGLSEIKFLSASIIPSPDYTILSAPSFYVGNIDPNDFETVTFNMHITNKINFIPVKVEYRDQDNKEYTKTEFLPINIYSIEEAKNLGLETTNYTPIIIIVIVLIILLFIVIRIIRKRRRAKALKL